MGTSTTAAGPALNPVTGVITLEGAGRLRAWDPVTGAVHTLIHGPQATGKTEMARWLAAEYRRSGVVTAWMADPRGGQPASAMHAARAASGLAATMEMLRDLAATVEPRLAVAAQHLMLPSPQVPMLRLILDDAGMLHRDPRDGREAVAILERVAQVARHAMIGMDVIASEPTRECLSGSLLDTLKAGNVIGMRFIGGQPGYLPGDPPCRVPLA
jgi:hypothetical protein